MQTTSETLPPHLKRYVVKQNYEAYTFIDQAVWRFIMRSLKEFLGRHAHPLYIEGLAKTGISVERIPRIDDMNVALSRFGWAAVPVSGFIPPAAFMELQSLSVLPIAADMRTIEHLEYTPAPDIVHEAAGHAPILVDPDYAQYLRNYAQVAKKAILSAEDIELYDAIRSLSDIKEDPSATEQQVKAANERLEATKQKITFHSEGSLLSRMNWWTAEYGLIGSTDAPKLYGAGLLSSVGESRSCLGPRVKHIPFSYKCVDFSYDITEPQPQLFVTPDFQTLSVELEKFASTMAYRVGGVASLKKAVEAQTVNTVTFDNGLQVSGVLKNYLLTTQEECAYLQFDGPAQICKNGTELQGHGVQRHAHGYGMAMGHVRLHDGLDRPASKLPVAEMTRWGWGIGKKCHVTYRSGVEVRGILVSALATGEFIELMTFTDCEVICSGELWNSSGELLGDRVLFQPAWGEFDLVMASSVPSVSGGPVDRRRFGVVEDFPARRVEHHPLEGEKKALNQILSEIRSLRETRNLNGCEPKIVELMERLNREVPKSWLPRLELLEIAHQLSPEPPWKAELKGSIERLAESFPNQKDAILNGLRLARTLWA